MQKNIEYQSNLNIGPDKNKKNKDKDTKKSISKNNQFMNEQDNEYEIN